MAQTEIDIATRLARLNPDLAGLFAEHKVDHRGEVLPHLFVGDIARWALEALSDPFQRDRLERVLGFLESEFERTDDDGRELIAVSFLEGIPRPGKPGSEIRELLGPALTEGLREIQEE